MPFPFIQISYEYCQKPYNGFLGFLVISTTSQILLIYIFLMTMKRRHFKFFLKFARICILFFFLNERNITTSLLMIHLKGPIVHYANLSSSSKIKPFLYYGTLNVLFFFYYYFLFMFILMKLLSKNLWNNYHFLIQISKISFKM